ncbi:calmodulin isoform X2 [Melitaea cinxia]|uniref:calmodulin isoform X2 n=1 Tax=Melitaea cinxia TaxID=113334 RepID=UPI001E274979|nr:calmodulin isoform X2 [Melitaea cinxia]
MADDNTLKTSKPKKSKGEKSRSRKESDVAQDEVKKFKENLLQSASSEDTILSENYAEVENNKRYSTSKARQSLSVPKNVVAELDENKIFELKEASDPLDFDSFVNLLGYKTLELDSEETLIAALSRWDIDNTGYISEERIRHDLMTWGDRFTEKEADYALDEAPTIQKDGYTFIDYKQFCSKLSGLRKPNKQALQV